MSYEDTRKTMKKVLKLYFYLILQFLIAGNKSGPFQNIEKSTVLQEVGIIIILIKTT